MVKRTKKNLQPERAVKKLKSEVIPYDGPSYILLGTDVWAHIIDYAGPVTWNSLSIAHRSLRDIIYHPNKINHNTYFPPEWSGHRYEYNYDQRVFKVACQRGSVYAVEHLLKDERIDPSYNYNQDMKEAVQFGHIEIVKLLLQSKRLVTKMKTGFMMGGFTSDNTLYAVANFAWLTANYDILILLMKDERVKNDRFEYVMMKKVFYSKPKVLEMFLKAGLFKKLYNNVICDVFIRKGNVETMKLLTNHYGKKRMRISFKKSGLFLTYHEFTEDVLVFLHETFGIWVDNKTIGEIVQDGQDKLLRSYLRRKRATGLNLLAYMQIAHTKRHRKVVCALLEVMILDNMKQYGQIVYTPEIEDYKQVIKWLEKIRFSKTDPLFKALLEKYKELKNK